MKVTEHRQGLVIFAGFVSLFLASALVLFEPFVIETYPDSYPSAFTRMISAPPPLEALRKECGSPLFIAVGERIALVRCGRFIPFRTVYRISSEHLPTEYQNKR